MLLSKRSAIIAALLLGLIAATPIMFAQPNDPTGAIANGAAVNSRLSVGLTEDEAQIKATAGILLSITATNTNAAARYVKCFNQTAANAVPGTSTPWLRLAIPPATTGGVLHATFPNGSFFDTALTCSLVTGAADSDVTEVAATEVAWFITYK